jgi:Flp pilus assembly protein TadG
MKVSESVRARAAARGCQVLYLPAARVPGFWSRIASRCAQLRRLLGNEGGALVEFALVLPLMMMLITGLFSFGIALTNYVELTQATGSGAQYLQTLRTSTSDPCADTLSAIMSAAPNFQSSKVTLTLTMNGTSVSGSSCSGDQSYLVQGTSVKVNAKYPCNIFVYGMTFTNACQLQAQVTEYEY